MRFDFGLTYSLDQDASPGVLQARLEELAFFSQSRIQLLDTNGDLVADTGSPQDRPYLALVRQPAIVSEEVGGIAPDSGTVMPEIAVVVPRQPDSGTAQPGDDPPTGGKILYREATKIADTALDSSATADGETSVEQRDQGTRLSVCLPAIRM